MNVDGPFVETPFSATVTYQVTRSRENRIPKQDKPSSSHTRNGGQGKGGVKLWDPATPPPHNDTKGKVPMAAG